MLIGTVCPAPASLPRSMATPLLVSQLGLEEDIAGGQAVKINYANSCPAGWCPDVAASVRRLRLRTSVLATSASSCTQPEVWQMALHARAAT